MRLFVLLFVLGTGAGLRAQAPPAAPPLTADAIMARVAANQDASEAARLRYVYVQHARVISRKGKTVRCEEVTDMRVTPTAAGSEQQLLHLDGRVLTRHGYATYHDLLKPKAERAAQPDHAAQPDANPQPDTEPQGVTARVDSDQETDRELVEHLRKNLTDTKTRDGLGRDLFPLTTQSQKDLVFTLAGREPRNGRETFHITFHPRNKDEYGWKGDAWIDAEAFQPVVVRTAMAKNIPFAVRTLLGTSLPGLGFTVTYAPQPDGAWFPATFGTEFKLHVLFFFNRELVVAVQNSDFEKTHSSSRIVGIGGSGEPQ